MRATLQKGEKGWPSLRSIPEPRVSPQAEHPGIASSRQAPWLRPSSLRPPGFPSDDGPSPRNLFLADSQGPHRQAVFVNGAARCFADRNEFVECFNNADRAECVRASRILSGEHAKFTIWSLRRSGARRPADLDKSRLNSLRADTCILTPAQWECQPWRNDQAALADVGEVSLAHGATDWGLALRKGGSHVPGIGFFDDRSVIKLEQDSPAPRRVARWQWLRGDLIDRVPARPLRGPGRPGWLPTQVYPARITPTPDYTDIPSRIYRHDDGPILPTVIPLFVGTAFHWLRKRCCHACLFAKSSVKP